MDSPHVGHQSFVLLELALLLAPRATLADRYKTDTVPATEPRTRSTQMVAGFADDLQDLGWLSRCAMVDVFNAEAIQHRFAVSSLIPPALCRQ